MDPVQQAALLIASSTLVVTLAIALRRGRSSGDSAKIGWRLAREGGLAVLAGGFVALASLALTQLVRHPSLDSVRSVLPSGPSDPATTIGAVCVLLLLCAERGRWLGHQPATLVAAFVPWWLVPAWSGAESARLPVEVLGLFAAVLYRVALSSGRAAHVANVARETALEATGDGVLLADPAGRLLEANARGREAFAEISSRRKDPESGAPVGEPRLPRYVRDFMQDPAAQHFTLRNADERVYEIWLGAGEVSTDRAPARALILRDVSERLRDEKRLLRLAHYDSLTGLANRRLFIERLEQAIADADSRASSVALLYVDLDRFKEVNDTLGHGAGDEMLRVIADRFQQRVSSSYPSRLLGPASASVARLGGDEFAVIVPDPENVRAIEELASRLVEDLVAPVRVGDRNVAGSASVGIAIHPQDGRDVETLVKHADSALYGAKRLGRNRFERYKPEYSREADRKRKIEEALRGAIQNGEFELHYQPKIDAASSRVGGFEALIRWNNAELGRVGPDEFIPIAEERGLIGKIGAWCLDEACRQQKEWITEGLDPVCVAVNVSSAQFIGTELQLQVREAIERHGIEPRWLEIELTERLLLEDSEQTSNCLADLQALGVSIALDDFGTGYSALTYLNRFPLDVVKMDRGLLENIETSESVAGIATAVIWMCHSIGMKVVAEGIETEEQLEILQEMSCDQIQGYVYSPALRAEDARRFLAARGEERPEIEPKPPTPIIAPPPQPTPETSAAVSVEAERWEGEPAAEEARSEPTPHVLLVDDTGFLQKSIAPRLKRLGIPVFDMTSAALTERYVLPPDEHFHLVLTNPESDLGLARTIVEVASDEETGQEPALVFVGDEPVPERREELRAAGARMVMWCPLEDSELRFLVRAGIPLGPERNPRLDVRIPLDSMAWIRFRSRREVGILSSLSRHGGFIEMVDPLDVGVSCKVEFDLPTGRFSTFGKVIYRHCAGDSMANGIGVEFYGMTPASEHTLAEVVEASAARYRP